MIGTLVHCITCHVRMVPVILYNDYPDAPQGYICLECGIVYDIRQVGPSNRELERDYGLYRDVED